MAWRIIVRIGILRDAQSPLRNSGIRPLFEEIGLRNTALALGKAHIWTSNALHKG